MAMRCMLWAPPTDRSLALRAIVHRQQTCGYLSPERLSGFGPKMEVHTFANEHDRQRLQPAAVAGIRRTAAAWRLPGTQAAALLATSPSTWYRIRADAWNGTFN